jgi:hypothetical protein
MTTIGQPVPELPVGDLNRARDYYCDKLGFKKEWALPEIAAVARGKIAIFFRLSTNSITPQSHWILADDVDATFAEMQANSAVIVDPISNKPWGLRQSPSKIQTAINFYPS